MKNSHQFGPYKEMKRVSKTKYKYVSIHTNHKKEIFYHAYHTKYGFSKYFDNEKDAAIAIDILLLNKGLSPINILKKA
jgi:L-ascorbate metabolism protein UlaG (beta-lactamase superfamily)